MQEKLTGSVNGSRFFSFGQIIFGSILASPLAGSTMIVKNYFSLNRLWNAYLAIAVSMIAITCYLFVTFAFLHKIPEVFHIIISTAIVGIAAHFLQTGIDDKIALGEFKKMSTSSVLLVFLLCWVAILVITYLAIVLIGIEFD